MEPKVHYYIHKCPTLASPYPVPHQSSQCSPSHFCRIHFNIIPTLQKHNLIIVTGLVELLIQIFNIILLVFGCALIKSFGWPNLFSDYVGVMLRCCRLIAVQRLAQLIYWHFVALCYWENFVVSSVHWLKISFMYYVITVRVSGYRYRGPGFDPRGYQIFWIVVGLERGPLSLVSLVRSIEELLEWKK